MPHNLLSVINPGDFMMVSGNPGHQKGPCEKFQLKDQAGMVCSSQVFTA